MLLKLNEQKFEKIYAILVESFPEDERRSYDEQYKLLKDEKYTIYSYNDSEEIVGFIAVWDLDSCIYLEHFAVSPKYRNRGYGKVILDELKNITSKQIVLEVEPPHNNIEKRRINFYERNGFILNDYPYIQPAYSKGKKELPLMIMSSEKALNKQDFNKVKEKIYKFVYKKDICMQ